MYYTHLITPSRVGLITASHRGEAEAPKYKAPCLSHTAQEFRKLRWRPGPQPKSCLLLPRPGHHHPVITVPVVTLHAWLLPASLLFLSLLSLCLEHTDPSAQLLLNPQSPTFSLKPPLSPTTLPSVTQTQPLPWTCFKGVLSLPTWEHNLPGPSQWHCRLPPNDHSSCHHRSSVCLRGQVNE